jgi:aminoglycoside 3-N-acetyltransferase
MGALTEYFRTMPGTLRSLHPTEPVCAFGLGAEDIIRDHFGQLTPYNEHSPWKKIMDAGGKILYVGVTLINSGTHLHTLEDAVDFKFPVYYPELFQARVVDANGEERMMNTKVHNPEYSAKRRCDELIPVFEQEGVLKKVTLGKASCLLLDAKKMFDVMLNLYHERGVTMYTPQGS